MHSVKSQYICLALLLVTGSSVGIPFSTEIRDPSPGVKPSTITLTHPDTSAGLPDLPPGSILVAKTVDIGGGTETPATGKDGAAQPEQKVASERDKDDGANLADLSIVDAVIAPNQTVELKAHIDGSDKPLKIVAQTGSSALPVRLVIIPCKGESGCREKRQSLWKKACSGASRVSTHCFFE